MKTSGYGSREDLIEASQQMLQAAQPLAELVRRTDPSCSEQALDLVRQVESSLSAGEQAPAEQAFAELLSLSYRQLVPAGQQLTSQLADLKGEPRPGEQVDLTCGAAGGGRTSYFATDLTSGLQVSSDGMDHLSARRSALSLLRHCLSDPDATAEARMHSAFCRCASPQCFWSRSKEPHTGAQMGRSDDEQ